MADLIEGEEVSLGGTKYTVPALTLGQIRRMKDKIQALATLNPMTADDGNFNDFLDVVHAALGRNYPDLTREQLVDLIDLRNVKPLMQAIVNASGFVPAGEAKAGN